jgi:hypothetical protein
LKRRAVYTRKSRGHSNSEQTAYALDASIIDLCLSVFPSARFRSRKAGIKLHTLLDLCGNIPAFVWVTDAKTVDARILDLLLPDPGAIYILDRGYNDYKRLYQLHRARATFVTRARKNLNFQRLRSRRVDRAASHFRTQGFRFLATD